jgi:integrase/recombinase XerD
MDSDYPSPESFAVQPVQKAQHNLIPPNHSGIGSGIAPVRNRVKGGTRPAVVEEMQAWLDALRTQGRSGKTLATYATALKNLRGSLAKRRITLVSQITTPVLIAWQARLVRAGCAPATVELFTRATRLWLAWTVGEGRLLLNPAAALNTPRLPKTVGAVPSADEMERLICSISGSDRIGRRDRALLELAYSTGARLEEIARLDVSSVDFANRMVRLLGKFDRERMVPLTKPACQALASYLRRARPSLLGSGQDAGLFISSRTGHRMASSAVAEVIKGRARRAGFKLSPHGIRRAFATHLLQRNASPAAIRDLLGHQSYRHLGQYLQLHPSSVIAIHRRSKLNR